LLHALQAVDGRIIRWVLWLSLVGALLTSAVSHAQTFTPSLGGTPPPSVAAGQLYVFTPTVTVPDGQSYSLSISGMPAWATFDATTGRLAGTPSTSDIGLYTGIRIVLKSGQVFVSLPQFSIEVLSANRPPTIGGTPAASVTVGRSYSFTPTASDADGDALTFSITGKPAWASFSSSTGRLSGSPGSSRVGSYPNIVITASDGKASASLGPFSIEVRAANTAPTIAGTPAEAAQAGMAYAFTPVASDIDGQALTFSIAGRPAWASFDSTTGMLAGTPTTSHIGVHSNIVISVSDGLLSASLPPFSITVDGNRPPAISGTPSATATVGKSYSFRPTVVDPEGDALRFSIVNKPAWASFASSSGRIYGTPGSTRVGTYSGIRISVSDGTTTVALPEFSITVAPAVPTGSATVSWSPPSTFEDGTPIANLAGFVVAYGPSPGDLSNEVEIPSPSITSAVIEALTPGTWYFAVKAYTTASIESDLSTVAYKIVN
jgi:hypothetical protein